MKAINPDREINKKKALKRLIKFKALLIKYLMYLQVDKTSAEIYKEYSTSYDLIIPVALMPYFIKYFKFKNGVFSAYYNFNSSIPHHFKLNVGKLELKPFVIRLKKVIKFLRKKEII